MPKILITESVMRTFTEMTRTIIDACMVRDGQQIGARRNMTGRNLLLPGYSAKDAISYPAFGGYPVGWHVNALMLVDTKAAEELWNEYYASLTQDWGKGLNHWAWECVNPELHHYQNPGYMTTVALPFVTLRRKFRPTYK